MFFDEPPVNEKQIMLSAKADLAKVQEMIDKGQWTQAQNQLAEVSSPCSPWTTVPAETT